MSDDINIVEAVRTDVINFPERHEHVILIKLSDGRELSVGEVVGEIEEGARFQLLPSLLYNAFIHVHPCPYCDAEPYLCGGGREEG